MKLRLDFSGRMLLSALFLFGMEKSFAQTICIQFFNEAYTGGNQPRSIAAADFNHDDHIDLATANFESSTISILFGNGDGSFDAPVNYPCGVYPNDIATADFNNDGNADLVTANEQGSSVTVYLGSSNGVFGNSANYSAGSYTTAVTTTDINNDSIIDLLTANDGSSNISALIGNGDGTFQSAINSSAPGGIVSVAVADFNNDGWQDIVYCHELPFNEIIHYFCIQYGDGAGNFSTEVRIDSIRYCIDAIAADVNHDGYADVVTADFFDDTASVFYGNGDGTFDSPLGYAAYIEPDAIVLTDMNEDNIPDMLVADYGSNSIAALPGYDDGTFGDYVHALGAVDPQSLAVGDFNEDGLTDIATGTTYFGSAYYAIILNCTATGIENLEEESLTIHPNPVSSDELVVQLPIFSNGKARYEMSNVLGQCVMKSGTEFESGSMKIDMSAIAGGTYFLKIVSGSRAFISKIVKQ